MRTVLICHHSALLDREGLARWLASFSTLSGVMVIRESRSRVKKRVLREIRRVGPARFLDVLAFRGWYRLCQSQRDRAWETGTLNELRRRFDSPHGVHEILVSSPNSPEAESFIRGCKPDLMIARCKTLLKEQIYSAPSLGTYVMHPGICPEYHNAHGCFWARARGDVDNVGMTLLRVDSGVDTGPVFGYFRVHPTPGESPIVTEHRVVFDHLDAIRDTLQAIAAGNARPLPTTGRHSATWGQPWLSAYARMRWLEH